MQGYLLFVLIVGFSVTLLWLMFLTLRLKRLESRFIKALGGGRAGSDIESTLVAYFDKLNATEAKLNQIKTEYSNLQKLAARSYQKMGLVRFNPFRDTGGDQSFAICLLDSQDSGLVLTTVHGRQGTRVYAKSVEYGQSPTPLSDEEKEALRLARAQKGSLKSNEMRASQRN